MNIIILLTLAILAYAFARDFLRRERSRRADGWAGRLVAMTALILAFLIVLNPEFIALGLVGDATFFDFLVLLLSLQLQTIAARVCTRLTAGFKRTLAWLTTPRLSYFLILSAWLDLKDAMQKIGRRFTFMANCAA